MMRTWFLHARESFWFLPTLFGVGAVVLALGLIEVDRALIAAGISSIPMVEDLSATGGRAILSAIGGTMLGVAATSFSITISVLATTTSAYGPRLVRNFMADRGNQLVLAVLTSTFLYSLIVLRSVHTEADSSFAFVPVIAVSVAVVLAVADVAVLVYFIHHIATSVQITTLQQRVLTDLEAVIELLYPAETTSDAEPVGESAAELRSTSSGYLQSVDTPALVSHGHRRDESYRLRAFPGDYVVAGDVLLEVFCDGDDDRSDRDGVLGCLSIGTSRTPHQDVRYALQQLTEIGVRGLASGTNDPYTAVGAIDALSSALVTLCSSPGPRTTFSDEDDIVRVVCAWPTAGELTADVYTAIRSYGLEHPLVVEAAIRLTRRLDRVATGATREALADQVAALTRVYRSTDPDAAERPLLHALDSLASGLAHPVKR